MFDTSRNHTDCKFFTDIPEDELPQFARFIFEEHMICDDEKFKFINVFLTPYLSNNEFRKLTQELSIYFVYFKLWDYCAKNRHNADIPRDVPGTRVMGFLVSDNPERYYM